MTRLTAVSEVLSANEKPPKVARLPIEKAPPLRPLCAVIRSYCPACRPVRPVRFRRTLFATTAGPAVTIRS